MNSAVPELYHTSPVDAAVEVLWFNGIVVVVVAGNNGTGVDLWICSPGKRSLRDHRGRSG